MRKFLQPFIPAAFLLMAAFIMSSSPAVAKSLAVDVAPNLDTFDAMREAAEGAMSPTGPFYIEGQIFDKGTQNPDGSIPEGATAIGTFYWWGWTYDGVAGNAVVSQIFAIDGRGIRQEVRAAARIGEKKFAAAWPCQMAQRSTGTGQSIRASARPEQSTVRHPQDQVRHIRGAAVRCCIPQPRNDAVAAAFLGLRHGLGSPTPPSAD